MTHAMTMVGYVLLATFAIWTIAHAAAEVAAWLPRRRMPARYRHAAAKLRDALDRCIAELDDLDEEFRAPAPDLFACDEVARQAGILADARDALRDNPRDQAEAWVHGRLEGVAPAVVRDHLAAAIGAFGRIPGAVPSSSAACREAADRALADSRGEQRMRLSVSIAAPTLAGCMVTMSGCMAAVAPIAAGDAPSIIGLHDALISTWIGCLVAAMSIVLSQHVQAATRTLSRELAGEVGPLLMRCRDYESRAATWRRRLETHDGKEERG